MIEQTYTGVTITRSADLPVGLEDARRQLRLDDLSQDDDHVALMVRGICMHIERLYGHALLTQTVVETHCAFPDFSNEPLYLSVRPGSSVTNVKYVDSTGAEQTFSSSDYEVGKNSLRMFIVPKVSAQWPTDLAIRPDAVRVTYVAGYGATPSAVPSDIKLAVLNMVGKLDSNREDAISEKMSASDHLLRPIFEFRA